MAAALINALGKKEGDTETDTKKATEEAVAKAQAEAEEAVKAEIDEAVTKGETEGKGQCPARLPREFWCRARKNAGLPQVTMDSVSRLPTESFQSAPGKPEVEAEQTVAQTHAQTHGCMDPRTQAKQILETNAHDHMRRGFRHSAIPSYPRRN